MSEVKIDSAIKLFGKTISLPPPPAPEKAVSDDDVSLSEQRHSCLASSTSQDSKDESIGDCEEKSTSSDMSSEDEKKEDEKGLKKPEKIIPCPRCSSMDTKFCYFNNYNVNQPRHFCKKCQRYWTSGGTMRNVPIGSGRRKTKNALLPNYHHIMVSDSDSLRPSFKSNTFLVGPHAFPMSFYPTSQCWGSGNDNPRLLSLLEPIEDSMAGPSPPPVLGKHPREGRENHNGVLMLKTLRIHDPIEAAKSSIWSTLGIKNDTVRLFKGFESKGDRPQSVDQRKVLLQANPAAFSRSLHFHERA